MNRISELKQNAKEALKGNWVTVIVATLLASGIIGVTSSFAIGLLLIGPIGFGIATIFMNIKRRNTVALENLFVGFSSNFVTTCCSGLLISLYTILWTCLFIIPGIVKSLSYAMTYYILNDHPEMKASEAITESRKMMNGYKGKLFMLYLSFIGWYLLSILTCGILVIYVSPYVNEAVAQFYESLKLEKEGVISITAE